MDLGFFLKLRASEILGLLSDVILFVLCVFEGNKETEKCSRPLLGIRSTLRTVPATEGAVSQSGSINLSAYPSKNPLGPLGAKGGHWQECIGPGVTKQPLNTHSSTLI